MPSKWKLSDSALMSDGFIKYKTGVRVYSAFNLIVGAPSSSYGLTLA